MRVSGAEPEMVGAGESTTLAPALSVGPLGRLRGRLAEAHSAYRGARAGGRGAAPSYYSSLTTQTLTLASTSACSLMPTVYTPRALMGSSSRMCRRSMSCPCLANSCAMV